MDLGACIVGQRTNFISQINNGRYSKKELTKRLKKATALLQICIISQFKKETFNTYVREAQERFDAENACDGNKIMLPFKDSDNYLQISEYLKIEKISRTLVENL
tara:strand:- start:89 stop:403 length:315 start_codon:yes stop_codon:yes gene_type:complete